ncbi:MAG: GNAT family N-acetyltransferase [Candidatus Pelethousia sp.]|nr:GNAT family N-acetyltransferase [Candidatus Pelethousia sp.]
MVKLNKLAPFFAGWEKAMILSCLQGHMGYALADNEDNPAAAQLVVGDFCFFAGVPSKALAARAAAPIIVPGDEAWGEAVEAAWGDGVEKALRYAVKKEPTAFDTEKLTGYAQALPEPYALRAIDAELYGLALQEDWSKDLCSQFADYADYRSRGLGVAVLYGDQLVSGASSYAVYNGGIEIEIDSKGAFRGRGLATACGAGLILECLRRGLYPGWDAHDLRSMALAEKLGYRLDYSYTVYIKR